ncbi:hypothetical protein QBC47DRAFT_368378 [Echria macrotheca]|uniref:Uncharacterized protein n=1 Tax=Echria macrotheca TaxID=438768 RepID=A0AAJ0BMY7_9PEZI|nr:hypothetical protein QBC47DRAFT_368378 [Echria macrotheca]
MTRSSMVDRSNFHTLLQTGSWRTSRSRSPNPYDRSPQLDRSYESIADYPRSSGRSRRARRPPPPSVEDETESLAREYTPSIAPSLSDDEPKNRGDVDQQPILVRVLEEEDDTAPEQNAERRFVLVGSEVGTENNEDEPSVARQRSPVKSDYDDNTCRQYVLVSSDEPTKETKETKEGRKANVAKRINHQDLPHIETNVEPPEPSIKRSHSRRNREKPVIDQPTREPARQPDDSFLSPVFTHSTGGRERAYLDINAGVGRSPTAKGPREEPKSKRNEEKRAGQSSSSHRRMSSAAGPRPSANGLGAFGFGNPDDVFAFMMPGGEAPPRGERTSESPSKSRKSTSPPYLPTVRDRDRPGGQRSRRQSNARDQAEYYGSTSLKNNSSSRSERPRPRRDTETLLPLDPARSGPKGPSPLPSPRIGQGMPFSDPMLAGPRSPRSTTLPYPVERRRPDDYQFPPSGSPPRRQDDGDRTSRPRAPSRSASIPSGGVVPVGAPLSRVSTAERRGQASLREESEDRTSQGQYWQPPPFDPEKQSAYLDRPVTSYRRYSEDVQQGVLPQLPECRYIVPTIPRSRSGSVQFLSLPGAKNFIICPDCYDGVFSNIPEFNQLFVRAAPFPPDQPITCHFGSSPWYRIAFLMTLKHRYPDLRLLETVAYISARNQGCPGAKVATRIWYSMMDPSARRPIGSFSICPSCTEMIGALFPNLADIFFPMDQYPAPRKGVCELHFAPERKRFLEYFDLLETTSDKARNRRGLPNIQELADRVRDVSLMEECPRDAVLQNGKWHVMEHLPDFTVCDECYDEVVWPLVEDSQNTNQVANDFVRGQQTRAAASCQLYSDRMRDVFRRACRRNDLGYLEAKLMEKQGPGSDVGISQSSALQLENEWEPRRSRMG